MNRGKKTYIHQHSNWPNFSWNDRKLATLLADIHLRKDSLLLRMEALGIESGLPDAAQGFNRPLTDTLLFAWHSDLFYETKDKELLIGAWRKNPDDLPMRVYAGLNGKEHIYFEAPVSSQVPVEMTAFLAWFNTVTAVDPLIKAAIAHLWFVTIHPFDDGNGRMARVITDLQFSRADQRIQRFYSMNDQIENARKGYYDMLAETQKGQMDITNWLEWFLECLGWSFYSTDKTIAGLIQKASQKM